MIWILCVVFLTVFPSLLRAQVSQGYGIYSEGSSQLYIGSLIAPAGPNGPDLNSVKIKRIELTILVDRMSHRRLKRHFLHRTSINNSQQVIRTNSDEFEYFLSWLNQPFLRGDRLEISQQDREFRFTVNDKLVGAFYSKPLFNILLNAWIGETPPSISFKRHILGQEPNFEAQDMYTELRFSQSRSNIANILKKESLEIIKSKEKITGKKLNVSLIGASAVISKVPTMSAKKSTAQQTTPKKPIVKKKTASKIKPTKKPKQIVKTQPKPKATAKPQPKVVKIATPKPVRIKPRIKSTPKPLTPEEIAAQERIRRENYITTLREHIFEHLKYGRNSIPPRYNDTLRANISVSRDGKLVSLKFSEQSIFTAINRDIKRSVRRAQPFPTIPKDIPGNIFTFILDIEVHTNK